VKQIGTVRRFRHFQHSIDLLPKAGRQLFRDLVKNLFFGALAERLQQASEYCRAWQRDLQAQQ
jgi:hypothetical protein